MRFFVWFFAMVLIVLIFQFAKNELQGIIGIGAIMGIALFAVK